MGIKVLMADDHTLIRAGIHELLSKHSDIEVVGEAENGKTTLKLARELGPDIVIMDIAMPDMNGIEATYQLLSLNKNIKVIALSMYSDRRFVRGMLKAGAKGYLLKDCAFEDLVDAIHAVVANKIYTSPKIAEIIMRNHILQLKRTDFSVYTMLTRREVEVLQQIVDGKTTREIAKQLSVSVKTVETHRHQIMDKLGIYHVAGLTKFSIKEGLTTLDN